MVADAVERQLELREGCGNMLMIMLNITMIVYMAMAQLDAQVTPPPSLSYFAHIIVAAICGRGADAGQGREARQELGALGHHLLRAVVVERQQQAGADPRAGLGHGGAEAVGAARRRQLPEYLRLRGGALGHDAARA